MKKFWKKLLAAFALGVTVFGLSACQSVNQSDAYPDVSRSEVTIVQDAKYPERRYATATLVLYNDTIYNISELTFDVKVEYDEGHGDTIEHYSWNTTWGIARGFKGGVVIPFETEDYVSSITINSITFSKFQSLWETYLPWWIITIVLVSIGTLFYAFSLFRPKATKEELMEAFKEHMAGAIVSLGLVLLICLVPLMFSGWFVSIILLGGFVAFGLLCGILTWTRMLKAE